MESASNEQTSNDVIEMIILNDETNNQNHDHHHQQQHESTNLIDHSFQISRHFITLLDEYRFLLSCIMKTCNCHSNFDYQFFLRKLEQRYNKLIELIHINPSISNLFNMNMMNNQNHNDDDHNNELSIEQLMEQLLMNNNNNGNNKTKTIPIQEQFIHRVRICERSKSLSSSSSSMMTMLMKKDNDDDDDNIVEDDIDMDNTNININDNNNNNNEDDDDNEYYDDGNGLPKFDISMKDAQIAYKCTNTKCEFLSFNQDDLIDHLKEHQLGGTLNASGITTIKTNDLEQQLKREIVYVCDQCGKEFAGQKWLDNHIENVHTSAKLYYCDYPSCLYKSKFRCVMEDHKRRHLKSKDFKCSWPDCDSEFVTKRDMVAHINFYHKGIKNYQCSWPNCEASFKDSNRLKHHYYIHTGERPYKCDVCDSSFKQLPHLHKHKRIHQHQTRTRTTKATTSSQRRSVSTRLSSSVYICPEINCQRKFRNAMELENHQKLFEHYQLIVKTEEDNNNNPLFLTTTTSNYDQNDDGGWR